MLSILYYLFKNAIALTIGAGIVMLLQKTILKRSCSIVKTLWIILIVSAFFPFEIFNLKVKTQTDNLGANVAQSTGTGYGLYGYIFNIVFVVWAVVAVAIFVYKLAKHKSSKCDLKNLTHFKNNIYLCKADQVGITSGFFRTKIIISDSLSENQFMHVLNHESHHAKAKDNLIKLLYLIVCCVYWFAPVLWKGVEYLENIIELCCDSKAVVGYTKRDIDDYAICLSVLAGCNLDGLKGETAFSKGHGKTYGRIFNLINNEKIGFVEQVVGKVLAVLLIASMFVGVKFVSADDTIQNDANNSSYAVESMRVAEVDDFEEVIAYNSAGNTVICIAGENE